MTAPNDYLVAAEQTIDIPNTAHRPGSSFARPDVTSPAGRHNTHAYLDGADLALCGVGVGPLVLFPLMRFGQLNPRLRCVECSSVFDSIVAP